MRGTLDIAVLTVATIVAGGCGRIGFERLGPGADAGPRDAGATDSGSTRPEDAGALDAGASDAGAPDAGPVDAGPRPSCVDRGPIVAYDFGGSDGPTYPDVASAPPDVPITAAGSVAFDATSAILSGGELRNDTPVARTLIVRLREAPGFSVLVWALPAIQEGRGAIFAIDSNDRPVITLGQGGAEANYYRLSDDRLNSSHTSGLRPWLEPEIATGGPRLLALTYDVATGHKQPYEDGVLAGLDGSTHEAGARVAVVETLHYGLGHTTFSLEPDYWRGRIFRVEIYETALTATEMRCVFMTTTP